MADVVRVGFLGAGSEDEVLDSCDAVRLHLDVQLDRLLGPVRLTADGRTQEWSGDDLTAECERRGIRTVVADGKFVLAVADGRPATPDASVALRAHVLCDAVYGSAASVGMPVAV